jgi:hypothetical protein
MSDTTADLPVLPSPPASEDIRRALADVDARLSAWVAAVAGAKPAEPQRAEAQPAASPSPQKVEPAAVQPLPVVAEAPAPVAEVIAAQVQAVEPPPAPAEPEPTAPSPAARDATREEDEALMASLDPETAQAIKVMRRLSFEDKSVRQLLEEYEQTRQSQGASDNRKKSWWSRG